MTVPLLSFTGAEIEELTLERAEVSLPFRWLNTNPFGSMYFACILMASEASTGAMMLLHGENHPEEVSPIVASLDAEFIRAGRSDMTFICDDGAKFEDVIEEAAESKQREETTVTIEGYTEDGKLASRVDIDWSVKVT